MYCIYVLLLFFITHNLILESACSLALWVFMIYHHWFSIKKQKQIKRPGLIKINLSELIVEVEAGSWAWVTHETKAGVSDEKDSGFMLQASCFRLQASGFSETQLVLEEHMYTITHTNAIWIHRAEPMINFLMQTAGVAWEALTWKGMPSTCRWTSGAKLERAAHQTDNGCWIVGIGNVCGLWCDVALVGRLSCTNVTCCNIFESSEWLLLDFISIFNNNFEK